jgi:hypothetical protein
LFNIKYSYLCNYEWINFTFFKFLYFI